MERDTEGGFKILLKGLDDPLTTHAQGRIQLTQLKVNKLKSYSSYCAQRGDSLCSLN